MRGCSVEYSDSGHCFIFFFFLHHCPLTLPPPYSQKTSLRISASRLYLNILYRSASTPSHLRTSTLLEPRTRRLATILAPHYPALLSPLPTRSCSARPPSSLPSGQSRSTAAHSDLDQTVPTPCCTRHAASSTSGGTVRCSVRLLTEHVAVGCWSAGAACEGGRRAASRA